MINNCKSLKTNDKILLFFTFIYFFSVTMSGLIRYFFSSIGLTFLIYIPKGLLLIGIIYYIISKFKIKVFSLFIFLFLIYSIIVSLFNNNTLNEIVFGIWILLPFFYGVVIGKIFINYFYCYRTYFFVLWCLILIGIMINVFYQWPWIGSYYNIDSFKITASREWSTGGISRLSGFGRLSAVTASETLLIAILLFFSYDKLFFKLLIWFISGIVIILTTTKTVIIIWLILTFLFILSKFISLNRLLFVPLLLSIIIIVLPFFSKYFYNIMEMNHLNYFQMIIFASFLDRLSFTWPWTIQVIERLGSPFFGIGIGGIGTSYKLFNPTFYSPADNLALYLYGLFGIFGLVLILFASIKFLFIRKKYFNYLQKNLIFYLFISVLIEGITLNVMEFPIFTFIFGIVLSNIFSNNYKKVKFAKINNRL